MRRPPSTTQDFREAFTIRFAKDRRQDREEGHMVKKVPPSWSQAVDTLRHLACGDSYPSLSYNFSVPPNTISLIVNEVCNAIKDEFVADVIQCPTGVDRHC